MSENAHFANYEKFLTALEDAKRYGLEAEFIEYMLRFADEEMPHATIDGCIARAKREWDI